MPSCVEQLVELGRVGSVAVDPDEPGPVGVDRGCRHVVEVDLLGLAGVVAVAPGLDHPVSLRVSHRRSASTAGRHRGGSRAWPSTLPSSPPSSSATRPLEWLRENLPAGWMEAIDAGDRDTWSKLRAELDYDAWCTRFGESGYATPTWPAEYGAGLSLTPEPGEARQRGAEPLQGAAAVQHHRHRHGRSDAHRLGDRGAEAAAPPPAGHQRGDLVPAVLRARRRLRRRRALDARRARRRRVGRHRPEGLDDARAHVAVGDARRPHEPRRAQAQGPHVLRPRHAGARRRGPSARADHRRRGVQRSVHGGRAHPRHACGSAPRARAGASRSRRS